MCEKLWTLPSNPGDHRRASLFPDEGSPHENCVTPGVHPVETDNRDQRDVRVRLVIEFKDEQAAHFVNEEK